MDKKKICRFILIVFILMGFTIGINGCGKNLDHIEEMQMNVEISGNSDNEKLFEDDAVQIEAIEADVREEEATGISDDIFYFSDDQYFPLFEGEWVAVEYVGATNDSQPTESYTEEYWANWEETINEIIKEYLGSEYRIEIDNMKYFRPITELGYIMENDDDLFFCTRFAHLDFPMTPPYIGACVYLLDTDENYHLIIDNNGTLLIQIKHTFFRLERKSETDFVQETENGES